MVSLLDLGQNLRGRVSTYFIVKELHRAADQGAVYLGTAVSNQHQGDENGRKYIVKSLEGR
ncbi:hypothetical protein LZ32DRAFT_684164 [Colletotrichum eremochloae]|nr:hypothetical protein LZ32DRAFT_684164 [Colletotrichum eremochloae]